jgi:FRG domain-containing protein
MIRETILRDWNGFARAIDDLCDGRSTEGGFVFRGHGQETHKLITSFDRHVHSKLKERNARFNGLLERFIGDAGMTEGRVLEREEWVGLAQHYGLPTRLLDWSYSPYVAAFFAISSFVGTNRRVLPVIWVLDRDLVQAEIDEAEFRVVSYRPRNNQRIKNQRGCFTEIKSDIMDLEVFLESKGLSGALRRLRLSKNVVPMAVRNLSLMDVSYERLFPGLDGLARQIWFEFQGG